MIIVCSKADVKQYRDEIVCTTGREPTVYRTTIGYMQYPNLPFFNPSWDIVMAFLNGKISKQQYLMGYRDHDKGYYVPGYFAILQKNAAKCLQFVRGLRADQDYILVCFCKEGAFCHRQVIAEKIRKHRLDLEVVTH